MVLYKLCIRLLSPLVTPLKGDTIWGHIVWGIANNEGDAAVKQFLNQAKDTPEFIVSSAFPSGLLCKPYPKPNERTRTMSLEEYAKIKDAKRQKYIAATGFFGDVSSKTQKKQGKIDLTKKAFETEILMHNSIDRYSNTVMDGNLFAVHELWPTTQLFDLYIASSFSPERIMQLCTWAFENGFGADASTGKGRIEIAAELTELKSKNDGTLYMALAPFVLCNDDAVHNLRAELFLRTGKIGGGFAACMSNPHKKTVLLYDEGAVFSCKKPIEHIGTLLTDIHSDSRICQAGFAPVIRISEELYG